MTWFAVCETTTGNLVSIGQIIADPLPAGLEAITLTGRPADNVMWDGSTKTFIARPVKVLVDRLLDILDHPGYGDSVQLLWDSLNATQRTRLRNGLIKLLGQHRWRNQVETISLDGSSE